jgi:uncharacterized protein (TIGR00255 family)
LLLSMTGFGEAHRQREECAVAVEVRTINSKYFKLAMRSGEGYSVLEPQIEHVVRHAIKRGTVQVNLRVERQRHAEDFRVDADVLNGYRRQLDAIRANWGSSESLRLDSLLLLPGVVNEDPRTQADAEEDWPLIKETLEAALTSMAKMREDEGRVMAADLIANCSTIAKELTAIEARAPLVADSYRGRLTERLNKILADYDVTLQPGDLVREVSLYAERADISEETVRLRSHLEQLAGFLTADESAGRKLEFLTQEMFRETNTIGSKSNDVQIARHVIEIKAAIERVREMIQNVE